MHGEGGQATVEWVALVLLATLALSGAAALASREADPGLGRLVAKRIANVPDAVPAAPGGAPGPGSRGGAPAPASDPRPAAPALSEAASRALGAAASRALGAASSPALVPRSFDAFPRLRGLEDLARHAWIACLGYRRFRHELVYPRVPIEPLPLDAALDMANDCLNPYDYLVED